MQKIIDFVQEGQNSLFSYLEVEDYRDVLEDVSKSTRDFYNKQFFNKPRHAKGFRASMLGQNIWVQLWNKFFDSIDTTTWLAKRKLLEGLEFEEFVYVLLRHLGYTVIERQSSLKKEHNGLTITGHPDFVIQDEDGTQFVLECKEVESKRFKRYQKEGMGLQYEMQLALYQDVLQAPGLWLVSNRDTKELMAIPYTIDWQQYATALIYTEHLNEVKSFDEAFGIFPVPRPIRHGKSNYRYVPYFYYQSKGVLHPVAHKLYQIDKNENDSYIVTGYNFPDGFQQHSPQFN